MSPSPDVDPIEQLATLLLLASSELCAQDWTAEQREVWERERTYRKLMETGDLDGFMRLYDETFVGWPRQEDAPVTTAEARELTADWFTDLRAGEFSSEIVPLAVVVHGDVALTYYRARTVYRSPDGGESTEETRLTHVWMKRDGEWRIVGGMSAPSSRAEDEK